MTQWTIAVWEDWHRSSTTSAIDETRSTWREASGYKDNDDRSSAYLVQSILSQGGRTDRCTDIGVATRNLRSEPQQDASCMHDLAIT